MRTLGWFVGLAAVGVLAGCSGADSPADCADGGASDGGACASTTAGGATTLTTGGTSGGSATTTGGSGTATTGGSTATSGTSTTAGTGATSGATSGSGPVMHVTIDVSGVSPLHDSGDYRDSTGADTDCATLMNDFLSADVTFPDGREIGLVLEPIGYAGPGSYSSFTLAEINVPDGQPDPASDRCVFVQIGQGSRLPPSTQTLDVDPTFSGTLTFSGWGNASDQTEQGSVSWTCTP